jgi:hypothetical protein
MDSSGTHAAVSRGHSADDAVAPIRDGSLLIRHAARRTAGAALAFATGYAPAT